MINSQYSYAHLLSRYSPGARWLDIGCGHGVVPDWTGLQKNFAPLAGIDLDRPAMLRNHEIRWAVAASGEKLPFTKCSFSLITANMVLEHVENPRQLFEEVARVLTPGGHFLAHTPNAYGYTTLAARLVPGPLRARIASRVQNRAIDDVYPTFYRANTMAALSGLARRAGLQSSIQYVTTSAQLGAFGPLAPLERVWMRSLAWEPLRRARPVLIGVFTRAE